MILTKKSFYIIIIALVLIDQITKYSALFSLETPLFLCNYVNLVSVKNFGVSFGILNFGVPLVATRILISMLVLGVIIYLLKTQKKSLEISLIVGGAIGNLFDRIFLGYVIDFIDVHIFEYHWPAFNVADCAVCIGVFLYVLPLKSNSNGEDHEAK